MSWEVFSYKMGAVIEPGEKVKMKMKKLSYAACFLFAIGTPTYGQEWTADCTDSGVPQKLEWTPETSQLVMFGVPIKLVDYNDVTITLQAIGYGDPYLQLSTETEDVYVAGTLSNRFKCIVNIARADVTTPTLDGVNIDELLSRIEKLEERVRALEQ